MCTYIIMCTISQWVETAVCSCTFGTCFLKFHVCMYYSVPSRASAHVQALNHNFGPRGHLPGIKIPYVCIEAATVSGPLKCSYSSPPPPSVAQLINPHFLSLLLINPCNNRIALQINTISIPPHSDIYNLIIITVNGTGGNRWDVANVRWSTCG